MQVGLRHFDSRTPDCLAVALRSGEHTRHALARELCERTGWLNALGRPCLSAAAAALPALAERIGTELPPARDVPDPSAAPAVPAGNVDQPVRSNAHGVRGCKRADVDVRDMALGVDINHDDLMARIGVVSVYAVTENRYARDVSGRTSSS